MAQGSEMLEAQGGFPWELVMGGKNTLDVADERSRGWHFTERETEAQDGRNLLSLSGWAVK